ncbi:MAG: ATP-binding protein [Candidatus Rokuibacteriota bacterium]
MTELAQNVALLLSLTLLYSVIRPLWHGGSPLMRAVAPGGLFGMIAIIGMHAPIVVVPGVIADGRVIPIVLAGPFGGPGAALTAAVLAGAYRIALGGAGALAGVGTILTAGLIGAWLGRPGARPLGPLGFIALGLVLDVFVLAWSLALPDAALAREVLGAALVPVGLFLPLGTLFLGTLLTHEERRHAERERLTFTQFSVDHAAEAMFWLDAEGRFVNANPATLALTGYARDELPVLRAWTVDLDMDAAAWPALWASVRTEGRVVAQRRYRRRDGTTVDVEVSYDFMDYRGREWISAVARDVSDRRRAEAERAEHLARERRLRVEAEAASTLKDEFLGTLSHELRTPLTAIVGYARMLRSRRLDDEAMGRALAVIERNGQAQSRLVNDLLDVSSIVLGKLRIEARSVDLTAVTRSVVDSVRGDAAAKSVAVDFEADETLAVSGDGARLQQVVGNLMSNALKFTPGGGRIAVRLERAAEEVVLTVRDTGHGIPPEFLPHVFDRFRQADGSVTRAYEGLGVGLAIVRALVELHGGRVSAASDGEGRGATFVVRLPAPALRPERAERRERPA